MKKKFILLAVTMLLTAGMSMPAFAGFSFQIPTVPFTPFINSVSNSTPVAGTPSFTVYANITGDAQIEACCKGVCTHQCAPNCSFDCGISEFTGIADPRIIPNPTCIPNINDTSGGVATSVCGGKTGNPKVYYYFDSNPDARLSMDMTYNSESGLFEANIPIDEKPMGEVVTYYVIAADNRGNTVSEVPDKDTAPCGSLDTWDIAYQTPAIDNCKFVNSVDGCGGYFITKDPGTHICSSSNYTVNDPQDDACGRTGGLNTANNIADVLGIAVGAGTGYANLPDTPVVCARIAFEAPPPQPNDQTNGDMDGYIMIFFNPDIPDPNPADVYMPNAFAITYVPEIGSIMGTLVKALWSGECITNPNTSTADYLNKCPLISGDNDNLAVGVKGNDLTFIAKNALPNGEVMLGATSNSFRAIIATGGVDITAEVPFWFVDLSNGIAMVKNNHQATIGAPSNPAAPSVFKSRCVSGGTESTGTQCAQSTTKPANNTCRTYLKKSPDSSFATSYRAYHSMTDSATTAIVPANLVETITTNIGGDNIVNHNVTTLDGKPHYYFFTATYGELETKTAEATKSVCTVEDWEAPVPPTGVACATPDGNDDRCECVWTADTLTDPSIKGFNLYNEGLPVNATLIPAVKNVVRQYSETQKNLTVGQTHHYAVTTVDAGNNETSKTLESVKADCIVTDRKPPNAVAPSAGLVTGQLTANITWTNDPESEDAQNYSVYECKVTIDTMTECVTDTAGYSAIATNVPRTGTLKASKTYTNEATMCYWVKACDAAGNCSAFSENPTNRICINVTATVDLVKPDHTASITATAPETGKTCVVEWERITSDSDGPFENASFPDPIQLTGYKVYRKAPTAGSCASTNFDPTSEDPVYSPGFGTLKYTDTTGLQNGETYCYMVYGIDLAGNFSLGGTPPTPATCTPQDTLAPDPVTMLTPMDFDDTSCTPKWNKSVEENPTYKLMKCTPTTTVSTCTTAAKFDEIDLEETPPIEEGGILIYEDDAIVADQPYLYCVITKDAYDNPKTISYTTAPTDTNCAPCTPSNRPAAPVAVLGGAINEDLGVRVWYDDSPAESGGSYSVYLCLTNTQSLTGCLKIASGISPTEQHELGGDPYQVANANVPQDAEYYVGVTYTNTSGGESFPTWASAKVSLKAPEPEGPCAENPDSCKYVWTFSSKFLKYSIEECTRQETVVDGKTVVTCPTNKYQKVLVPDTDVIIEIVDGSTQSVTPLKSFRPDSTGTLSEIRAHADEIGSAATLMVRANYPAGTYDPLASKLCSNYTNTMVPASDPCYFTLKKASATAEGTVPLGKGLERATAGGGGYGGEIGNANGDNVVSVNDIIAIKRAYGSSYGSPCYRAWADFDLNGSVSVTDFAVLKRYMSKTIDVSGGPAVSAAKLTAASDPIGTDCTK